MIQLSLKSLDLPEGVDKSLIVGSFFKEVYGVCFNLFFSFGADLGCDLGVLSLAVYFVRTDEAFKLVFRPVVEAAHRLGFLELVVKHLQKFGVLDISFGLHVDLKLDVFDELGVKVELERRQAPVPLELGSFPLLVVVVPALDEAVIVVGLGLVIVFLLVVEGVDLLPHADLLLELLPDLRLPLLVLLLAHLQDLLDGLVPAFSLQSEDVSLPQLAQVVEVQVRKWVLFGPSEHCALLDHQLVPDQLVFLEVQHALLDRVLSDQSIDQHWPSLPDAVGSVCCLQVVLRVPVDVVDDDPVCRHQVEAQSSCSGGEEEDGVFWVVVEPLHVGIPLLKTVTAVDSAVLILFGAAVFGEDIEHDDEL
jgi:hypothetical protein